MIDIIKTKNFEMKNRIQLLSVVCIWAIFLFQGCGSSKVSKVQESQKTPVDEVEVIVPCSGADFFTNNKAFRANSLGESSDQVTAQKKALINARSSLASSIQSTIKSVTDNYVNSREFNNREEMEERFESLNREVVNQELSGTQIICEKYTKTSDGRYKAYIAIELTTDKLIEKYNERLAADDRLKIDYDYEQFKKTFEKEMEKFASSR